MGRYRDIAWGRQSQRGKRQKEIGRDRGETERDRELRDTEKLAR